MLLDQLTQLLVGVRLPQLHARDHRLEIKTCAFSIPCIILYRHPS
jgi:hypothetical protein